MGECEASGGKNREPGSCGPDGVLPRAGLMEGEQGHPRFWVQSEDCLTLGHKYGMPQALECRGRKGFFRVLLPAVGKLASAVPGRGEGDEKRPPSTRKGKWPEPGLQGGPEGPRIPV